MHTVMAVATKAGEIRHADIEPVAGIAVMEVMHFELARVGRGTLTGFADATRAPVDPFFE